MSKFYDKPSSDLLYQALLQVHTLEECRQFLLTVRFWSAPGPPAPPSAG